MIETDQFGSVIAAHDGAFLIKITEQAGPITLRQHYAGLAMQGILAGDYPITHDEDCCQRIAGAAHAIADAMIEAGKQ